MAARASRSNDDSRRLLLLGEQIQQPRLQSCLDRWQITGPVGLISPGWEEDEDDDQWVRESIRNPVVNAMLYALADELFARDPEVLALLRERQDRLRELRELYQFQLHHWCAALRGLLARRETQQIVAQPLKLAFSQLREVDRQYLTAVTEVIREFDRRIAPKHRPSIVAYQRIICQRLESCQALLVAGGHVGVLLNRLRLSRVLNQVRLPIIAWSGGAMALGDKIIFYDHFHPHAGQETEFSRQGMKFFRGLQLFPKAQQRLDLHNPIEMALVAGRVPDRPLILDSDSEIEWTGKRMVHAQGIHEIGTDGLLREFKP